jgi:hypothetical protein
LEKKKSHLKALIKSILEQSLMAKPQQIVSLLEIAKSFL